MPVDALCAQRREKNGTMQLGYVTESLETGQAWLITYVTESLERACIACFFNHEKRERLVLYEL
jgi:hypothetical protein